MRLLDAAGWLALALALASAAVVVLPLAPEFLSPSLDASFAATLHHAAAAGAPLISTYGPLGFVHYGLYWPDTFAALVLLRLACAAALAWPLAWLGWAATGSAWGAALAVAASAPFLAMDDLRGLLLPLLAVLIGWVPSRPPPAILCLGVGVGLALMALIKGTFLVVAAVALLPAAWAALGGERRVPWMVIGALAAAVASWWALGLGAGEALAQLDWTVREIVPGYAQAMQLPAALGLVAAVLVSGLLLFLAAVAVARRPTLPPQRVALLAFAVLLFAVFKVGVVRADVHVRITIAAQLVLAPLLALLWGGHRPSRVLGAALVLAALPAALLVHAGHRFAAPAAGFWPATPAAIQRRLAALPVLFDPAPLQRAHAQHVGTLRAVYPLPPLDGAVDVYTLDQALVLANGLALRTRPVFQSYMAYTPRLAQANAEWLAGAQAPPWVLFRPRTLNFRLPSQDDAASWPLLLSHYDPVAAVGEMALLERRAAPRPWRLEAIGDVAAVTGVPIAVPRAARVWARIDVAATLVDALAGALLSPPVVWMHATLADGRSQRLRLVPAVARAGLLLSPLVADAGAFTALLSNEPPPARVVAEIRLELGGPLGGSWGARAVRVEFFALQIDDAAAE